MTFSVTITIEDNDSGCLYRYDGGMWIQYCEPDINGSWEDLIYVWDDEKNQSAINMTIEDVAVVILQFIYSDEDEDKTS